LTVGRRLRGDIFTSTQRPLLIDRCIASMMRTSARPSAPLGSGIRFSKMPVIASELEEHAHVGGGISDLSFRGIRIELKFESTKTLTLADCATCAEQTVSYVVATGKRLGILCVLDNSPKHAAPFPADAGIDVLIVNPTKQASVYIVVVLIQANLARPSDLS
jgi:hypothetical protein